MFQNNYFVLEGEYKKVTEGKIKLTKGEGHERRKSYEVFKNCIGVFRNSSNSWRGPASRVSGHLDLHIIGAAMIVGIYATLGVFLVRAARNPLAHLSLIWFTVWSSIVHGGIMTIQSIIYPQHIGHLLGDVPTLFIIAIVSFYIFHGAKKP